MAKSKKQKNADALRLMRLAAAKGKQVTALRKLAPFAKEINVRLEKATKSEDQAYDHRLAAALQLDKAKDECKKSRINFKSWCEENVKQSYETVRRLASVGGSPNPKQALEDMRGKNKLANKKLRDKKAATAKVPAAGSQGPKETPTTRVLAGLDAMDDDAAFKIIKDQASKFDHALVTKSEAVAARKRAKDSIVDQVKALFNSGTAADKMDIVIWAAEQTGTTISNGIDVPPAGDNIGDLEIPDSLRREPATA